MRVHLDRANPPPSYEPKLVATGETDSRGRFGFDISDLAVARRQAGTNTARAVDLDVDAVSFDRRLAGYNHLLAPLTKKSHVKVTASHHIPGSQISSRDQADAKTGAQTAADEGYRITDETQRAIKRAQARGVSARAAARKIGTRWVKVSGLYVSRGMTGWFTMDKGRDTYAQIAYAYTGDGWNLGGMASEESSRGWSGTTAHHKGQCPVGWWALR